MLLTWDCVVNHLFRSDLSQHYHCACLCVTHHIISYVSHHITHACIQGLVPNENETIVLNILTEGQFDALVLEDTPLSDNFLFPPTPNPVDIGLPPAGLRRRRQAVGGGLCFDLIPHHFYHYQNLMLLVDKQSNIMKAYQFRVLM